MENEYIEFTTFSTLSDLNLLYALEDCEDNYDIDTTDDTSQIRYIIEMRKKLGLWDYSAEVEFWAFLNEASEILSERGI